MKLSILAFFLLFVQCTPNLESELVLKSENAVEKSNTDSSTFYILSKTEEGQIKSMRKEVRDFNADNLLNSLKTSFILLGQEGEVKDPYILLRGFETIEMAEGYTSRLKEAVSLLSSSEFEIMSQNEYRKFVVDKSN